MNNLFVYLELQEDSRVAEVSLELLTKGRSLATQLGCRLEAVAAGCNLEGIAAQVMPYGVDVLHLFDAEGLYPYTSLPHTSVLVNLFKEEQPQIALMGATVIGRDLGHCIVASLPTARPSRLVSTTTRKQASITRVCSTRFVPPLVAISWPPSSTPRTVRRWLPCVKA